MFVDPAESQHKGPVISVLPVSVLALMLFVIHFFAIYWYKQTWIEEFASAGDKMASFLNKFVNTT